MQHVDSLDSPRVESMKKWLESTLPSIEHATQQIIATFGNLIRYVGPLRAEPQAIQGFSPSGQLDDVGPRGEYAAAVYEANRNQTIDYYDPESERIANGTLEQAMGLWLRYLGIADCVSTREAAAPGVTWLIRPVPGAKDRPLHAVGVGVSQVLPILVAGLLSAPGTILVIEQPELHLHERPQGRLGDFFFGLTRVNKQVLVETHSAVLISQLRYRMVKDGQAARDAIAIYFVQQDELGNAQAHPIVISPRGAIENWPDGFFDESFRQEDRITQAGFLARSRQKNA
jgi:predicted ATPase